MKVMGEFGKLAPNTVFISLLLGAFAGILYVGLIPILLSSLEDTFGVANISSLNKYSLWGLEIANKNFAFAFFTLCVLILLMRTTSQVLLSRVSVKLTTEIRKRIYGAIINTSIDILEKIGPSRIITCMTSDVARIVSGANTTPAILINSVTIIGMLGYILIVNSEVFYFVMLALLIGIVTYQFPMIIARKYYGKVRTSMDDLQESLRGIVYGAKELKLNKAKLDAYLSKELLAIEKNIREDNLRASSISTSAMNYGDMLSFFVVGSLTFIFSNYYQVSNGELIAIIMIMLYISGPVSAILFSIPLLLQAGIAYRKMNNLIAEMTDEKCSLNLSTVNDWDEVTFKNVTYSYGKSNGFKVGPVDLTIKKGEILFIVGGNGSGKSTFSKLITQHYFPESGEIYFGKTKIDRENINSYRQCISSIYSDYYLFKTVHGFDGCNEKLDSKVQDLISDLDLSGKVKFKAGKFSTLDLSDGQRRRLALLVSFIEDKELYLFDEWAADQDPAFRDIYYTKILPELKAKGKIVIAISHDDRYFHVADKIVKFDSGVMV